MGVSENWGVPYFGVLIIRVLLFGVLYLGSLFFGNSHIWADPKSPRSLHGGGFVSQRSVEGSFLEGSCFFYLVFSENPVMPAYWSL